MTRKCLIFGLAILISSCSNNVVKNKSEFIEVVALGIGALGQQNDINEGWRIAHYLKYDLDSDSLYIMYDEDVDVEPNSRKVIYKTGIVNDSSIRSKLISGLKYLLQNRPHQSSSNDNLNEIKSYCGYEYYLNYKFQDIAGFMFFRTHGVASPLDGLTYTVRGKFNPSKKPYSFKSFFRGG